MQLLLLAVAAVAFYISITVLASPDYQPKIEISEVLSQNSGILSDEDGAYSDFVELHNYGKSAVNLKGWYLSDSDNKPLLWRLPSLTLAPGEYVWFFASGKDKEQQNGVWHTNFSISTSGEPIILTEPNGTQHTRMEPFEAAPNISRGTKDGVYVYFDMPTPGLPNAGTYADTVDELKNAASTLSNLLITEYMSKNNTYYPDEEGLYHDWVEIHNFGGESVSLLGWYLSDNEKNPFKWGFPAGMSIDPGGYLVLQCSGLTRAGHVPFSLSERDFFLLLTDAFGREADRIVVYDTTPNASYGKTARGEEGFFAAPSPGEENMGSPAPSLSELNWVRPSVLIMEYMSKNSYFHPDEDGDCNDWVELYNFGAETVHLTNYYLSDNETKLKKWRFPDGFSIMPGERATVQLSGKNYTHHASFSLSINDSGIFLTDSDEHVVDSAPIKEMPSHVSYGRSEDDHDVWLYFARPTPGEPNNTNGFSQLTGLAASHGMGGLYISDASFDNWVEITNASSDSISMQGWSLSNRKSDLAMQPLPNVTLAAGASGKVTLESFHIKQSGEEIILSDSSGLPVDIYTAYRLRSGNVYADTDELYVAVGTEITLGTDDTTQGNIHYTLDGSEPTAASAVYTRPIIITGNMVIRARVIAQNAEPGLTLSRTYLTDEKHTLPVITLASDPAGLFSHASGIYANGPGWTEPLPHKGANYWKDWERETHFAFYEDGGLGVEAVAGIKIFGQYARAEEQKSFSVFFRKTYGVSRLAYPLFPDSPYNEHDALILRTSGQDWNITKLRDSFIHNSVIGVTNVAAMRARPVIVYINGEYWGLYNLREKLNADYFKINEGIPDDEIDIIKANTNALDGTSAEYRALVAELGKMKMNTPEGYAFADANIDIDNWIDYWIVVTFFGNTDTGNIKCYKQQGEGHKWRWILFDQDWALFPSTYKWNPFDNMLHPQGHGVGKAFSTVVARSLMSNATIKERFIRRYAELLHTVLSTERLIAILDDYAAQIEPEIPAQIARWGGISTVKRWQDNVQRMRNIITEKHFLIKTQLKSSFNISDTLMRELFPEGW